MSGPPSELALRIWAVLGEFTHEENFLPSLFEALDMHLEDAIAYTPTEERAEMRERMQVALWILAKRTNGFRPLPLGEE